MLCSKGSHTFDLVYNIGSKQNAVTFLHAFGVTDNEIAKMNEGLIVYDKKTDQPIIARSKAAFKSLGADIAGLRYIKGFKSYYDSQYYIRILLEPKAFIIGKPTVAIYEPLDAISLHAKFEETLGSHLEGELGSCYNIANWDCKRIDYTMNLLFPSQTDVSIFQQISKITSNITSHSQQLYLPEYSSEDQSTAYGCKSYKIIAYNKQKEVQEAFAGLPSEEYYRLLSEAAKISRFEVQYKDVRGLSKKYKWNSRSILYYLQPAVINDILYKKYNDYIGFGDFVSRTIANRIINKDPQLSLTKKKNLYCLLRAISASDNLSDAKNRFITDGIPISYKGKRNIIKGSRSTFNSYLDDCYRLNINPTLIPVSTSINRFNNPVKPSDFGK